MKTSHKPIDGFKPFEFTITFETEAEANEFWHRLNCSVANIKRTSDQSGYDYTIDKSNNKLFNDFNKIYKPRKK